jgi:hypothetical protein
MVDKRNKKKPKHKPNTSKTKKAKFKYNNKGKFQYCCQPETVRRKFDRDVTLDRSQLIELIDKKWVNGTQLHYYFFTSSNLKGTVTERDIVREAFKRWKDLGIGLSFTEAESIDEAEIRIGFKRGDGAWSYVGRDILEQRQSARTMNFGWNIRNDIDTAIHEIGHTLGFPHEHQNPNSGIEWNEEAVYEELAAPPNNWDRETTFFNIIRKIPKADIEGSEWDKDSIMHYPFEAGLILKPVIYRTKALIPKAGLSDGDKFWVKSFYPKLNNNDYEELEPFQSAQIMIEPGEQVNFYIKPTRTRSYEFQTFGKTDTVMVLFEEIDNKPRYYMADDDSGMDFNARFKARLIAGRTYILRVRLYWQHREGDLGVMMW